MNVGTMFSEIQARLRDANGNIYKPALLVPVYNSVQDAILFALIQLGAEDAMSSDTITGDGANATFDTPSDFYALVPESLRPRSPITATSNYVHSRYLDHVGQLDPRIYTSPTGTPGAPSVFCTQVVAGVTQVRFGTIPASGYYYDYKYYAKPTRITTANYGAANTPFNQIADHLFSAYIEELARAGTEFTFETKQLLRAQAEADLSMVAGLRKLQDRQVTGSIFRNLP